MSSIRHVRTFELAAVVFTALGKFLFYDIFQLQFVFILLIFIFWTGYITWRVRHTPDIITAWGFRMDNFLETLKMVLPFGLLAIFSSILIGYYLDTIDLNWHIVPILLLYPLFGTLQQFLLMALVAGNLQSRNESQLKIMLISACLFSIIHYPDGWLVLGTFILALFYSYIYLRKRNLYVLGLFHGWLGAIFYYTVVEKDPFLEVFGLFF